MPLPRPHTEQDDAKRTRRRFLAVAVGLLAVAAACKLWPTATFWRQSRFAAGLAQYAERAPEGAARLTVRRVAECGLAGVDSLVRLASSPQVVAAVAAREALLNELASWELDFRVGGDEGMFAQRLRLLAETLADHVGEFDPAGRQWAGALAQQIVSHGGDVAGDSSLALLRSCETVLAATPPAPRRVDLMAPVPTPGGEARIAAAAPAMVAPAEMPASQPLLSAPIEPEEPLRVARSTPTAEMTILPAEPLPVAPERPAPGDASPWPGENPLRAPSSAPDPNIVEAQPLPTPPQNDAVIDVPSPPEARYMLRRYRELPDRELSTLIDAGTPYESLAVRQVLRERGAAESQAVAGRPGVVTDASRERLLETLSRLPAAEGRAMLRRLVVDADPEMRLKALTILATTDDPQLAAIVRRRAVEDADPRVTELASRILKERK